MCEPCYVLNNFQSFNDLKTVDNVRNIMKEIELKAPLKE